MLVRTYGVWHVGRIGVGFGDVTWDLEMSHGHRAIQSEVGPKEPFFNFSSSLGQGWSGVNLVRKR